MVLILVTLLGSVVADFQFNSRVDLQLALNARDELQAEYNAMTALRVRAMLLKHSRQIQRAVDGLLGGLLGGDTPMKLPIGQVLEMIPVECGLLSAIARKSEDPFADEGDVPEEEAFFQGECMATSTSEHSKISLNMLANPTNRAGGQVTTLLLGLLSDQKFEHHFQEDDRNGVHAESPEELVGAITDWIDGDEDQAVSAASDESRHYGNLRDHYRPKNAPFDSLGELQLVHGIDDDLYELLRDNVSIYNDGTQIELGTANDITIVIGLFAARHDGVAFQEGTLGIFMHMLQEARSLGAMGMAPLNVALLKSLVIEAGLEAYIDTNKLSQVFTDKASTTWYTIEAQGRRYNASRRIRAVFQANEGQFYYMRIE